MNSNKTTVATPNYSEIITPENVQALGERIALRSLKTCYQQSGQPFIYSLYNGLIQDIHTLKNNLLVPLSDGYDIAQTAIAFLCENMRKPLNDSIENGKTDKKGNPVTILRECFKAVNNYIMGERAHDYKRIYVEDLDANGNSLYYEVPEFWDMPTATDFNMVDEIIIALKLSVNEKKFLSYRLRGESLDTITRIMGISRDAINMYRKRIKIKAKNVPALAKYLN